MKNQLKKRSYKWKFVVVKKQRVLNLFNKSASYILLIRLVKDSFFIRSSVVLNEKEASQDVEQKNYHESRPIANRFINTVLDILC